MRLLRSRATLLLVGLALGAMLGLPVAISQQVGPTQQVSPVQVNPPGQAFTLQTYWSQTGTGAASSITLTQPAAAGKTNYVTGFEITGGGATAASVITVTLASGGTTIANYNLAIIAGATLNQTPLVVEFPQPIVGLAPGQNMVLTVPSFGAGNTNAAANIRGFTQ